MPDKKSPNLSLAKAYEKATGDGPIETTLELTEAQIKSMIRAADKLILDAADTASKIPAVAVNAAKTVVGAGIDGAKAAGKGYINAIKSLGKMFGGDFAPGTLMGPAPQKRPVRGPGGTPPKPRPNRKPGRTMPTKPRQRYEPDTPVLPESM